MEIVYYICMEKMVKYYVYILRCKDNSLYTGITTNIEKRLAQHVKGKGAKYTRSKGVDKIEVSFFCDNRSSASIIEAYIKKHNKKWKEEMIQDFIRLQCTIEKDLKIKIKKYIDTF